MHLCRKDTITEVKTGTLNTQQIQKALQNFAQVFDALEGYEQQELLELVIDEVELTKEELKIALLGRSQQGYFDESSSEYLAVSAWLPRTDSNCRPGG
jgi:hypothetical protein